MLARLFSRVGLVSCALAAALLLSISCHATETTQQGQVTAVDAAHRKITVALPNELSVQKTVDPKVLGSIAVGDSVSLHTATGAPEVAMDLAIVGYAVPRGTRLIALIGGAVVVLLAAGIASRAHLLKFLVGTDERYSNSKCQLALWFGAMMTAYLATLFLRMYYSWDGTLLVGGISLPPYAMGVSGLSALSFAGAKAVTVQNNDAAQVANHRNAAAIAAGATPRPTKQPSAAGPNFRDLFSNDNGDLDIGDFQMIFITLTAVVIYLGTTFAFLGHIDLVTHVAMPDLDTTLLAAFGIGHGAYLTKKMASEPGRG